MFSICRHVDSTEIDVFPHKIESFFLFEKTSAFEFNNVIKHKQKIKTEKNVYILIDKGKAKWH